LSSFSGRCYKLVKKNLLYAGTGLILVGIIAVAWSFGLLASLGFSVVGVPEETTTIQTVSNTYYLIKEPDIPIDGDLKLLSCAIHPAEFELCKEVYIQVILNGEKIKEFTPLCRPDPPGDQVSECTDMQIRWKTTGSIEGLTNVQLPSGFSGWGNVVLRTPNQFIADMPLVDSFPFEIHRESKLCMLPVGYMLATTILSANETLTMQVLKDRFNGNEVQTFCNSAPVLKIDLDSNKVIEQTVVPYKFLVQGGQYITIPDGQAWQIYGIIKTPTNILLACDKEQVYDANTNTCIAQPGFIFFCSEGIYDGTQKACIVQPDSKTICSEGVYNAESGKCEVIKTGEVICPANSQLIEEGEIQKCIFEPQLEYICKKGTLNPQTNKCEIMAEVETKLIEKMQSTQLIGFGGGIGLIVVGGLLSFLAVRRRR